MMAIPRSFYSFYKDKREASHRYTTFTYPDHVCRLLKKLRKRVETFAFYATFQM